MLVTPEVPQSVLIPRHTVVLLEPLADVTGESIDGYVMGSVGLVAAWGAMATRLDFQPEFRHGIISPRSNTVRELSLRDLCVRQAALISQNYQVQADLGVQTDSQDKHQFPVHSEHQADAISAVRYLELPFTSLLGAALQLRRTIIRSQAEGQAYVFTHDRRSWEQAVIPVVDTC